MKRAGGIVGINQGGGQQNARYSNVAGEFAPRHSAIPKRTIGDDGSVASAPRLHAAPHITSAVSAAPAANGNTERQLRLATGD
jgi:hypothetical protein